MRFTSGIALCILGLAGCATVPDVKYTYYQTKWKAVASVTQTLACDAAKQSLLILQTAVTAPSYSSDTKAEPRAIYAKDLRGDFASSEFKIAFTADGRLKTINQSSTGEGEAVAKAAVTLIATVAAVAAAPPLGPPPTECEIVDKWGGSKPVTITYEATLDSTHIGKTVPLEPLPPNALLHQKIKAKLPLLLANVSSVAEHKAGATFRDTKDAESYDGVLLKLQRIGAVAVTVTALDSSNGARTGLDESTFLVPLATSYDLPIPKPPLFGKQTFELIIADSGAISSISYNKVDGTAPALSAANFALNAETSVTAAKTAAIKAQNDLIAAQQKAILCESKPVDCK